MPGDFEFLNSRIRTCSVSQDRDGPDGPARPRAGGPRARKNASEMESLSIMFMWMDSILDANAVSVGNQKRSPEESSATRDDPLSSENSEF